MTTNVEDVLRGDIEIPLTPAEERYVLLKFVEDFSLHPMSKEELSKQIDTFLNFGRMVAEENSLFAMKAVMEALNQGLKKERGQIIRKESWRNWSARYNHIALGLVERIDFK